MVGRRKVASRLPPRMYEAKGAKWTSYYTVTAANKYVGLGRDLIAAKKKLAEIEGEVARPGTMADLIDEVVADLKRQVERQKRAPRTLADREADAKNLKDAFGKMRPEAVEPRHVWTYLHKARGVEAPVRANREISFLQVVFNWARGQGLVNVNPCVGVERNEETPRTRLVTPDELREFYVVASNVVGEQKEGDRKAAPTKAGNSGQRAALAAMLAYLTGKAQGQILKLHRNQIKPEGIEFPARKGGARVLVQWSDELRAVVAESIAMPAKAPPLYVVHTSQNGPYTPGGFKKIWRNCMDAWTNQGGEAFTFHDLRSAAVTDVIGQGRKASELTGHRLESTVAKVYDRRVMRVSKPVR